MKDIAGYVVTSNLESGAGRAILLSRERQDQIQRV